MSDSTSQSGGIGFIGLLIIVFAIVFVVVKLLYKIDWSRCLVLSPLLIAGVIFLFVLSIFLIIMSIFNK